MKVYGYPSLQGKSAAEIKKMVAAVWEEITLQQEEPISVKLEPEDEEKPGGLLSKVLPKATAKTIKVAFIHDRSPETSGWTYGHEMGRAYLAVIENFFGLLISELLYLQDFQSMDLFKLLT